MANVIEQFLDALAADVAERVIARLDAQLPKPDGLQPTAYRPDQAAQVLGLSVTETRRLIASGELGSRRVGRAILVPRDAIDAFLHPSDIA